jgi:hypothetical protein
MKTATEWLFEKLWNTDKDKFTWYAILKQAKEMEKEQILAAKQECCQFIENAAKQNGLNLNFNKSINNKG